MPLSVIPMKVASRRYEFDCDFCKGSGFSVEECPSGAITLVPERL
jgi:Pyruvate/2-oxoacid:ferredoxin oxidoreductase delta subunit